MKTLNGVGYQHGTISAEPWYRAGRIISNARIVHRPLPANISLLPVFWQQIFNEIATQQESSICLLEGVDIEIDIDGVVWTSPTRFCLDHHEFSEKRVVEQRLVHWPLLAEWFAHPRVAARCFNTWLEQAVHGVKRENLPHNCRMLYFSDNRAQGNFYHWIVDSLSRLLVAEPWIKESYLLLSENQIRCKYITDSLAILGFGRDRLIPLKKGVRYKSKNIQIITCSIFATGACSSEGISLVKERLAVVNNKPEALLYLARKQNAGRAIANQDEFINAIKYYGFKTIYAEDIEFENLVEILGKTKILIGVYGAAMTHAIFLPRNGHVIELAPNKFITQTPNYWGDKYASKYSGDYYYSLSVASHLNYHLIPCSQKNKHIYASNAEINVDIDMLTQTLSLIL